MPCMGDAPFRNHAMYGGCPIQKPCHVWGMPHSETMPTFQMIQNIQNTWHGSCSIHFPCQGSPCSPCSPRSPKVGMAYAPCNSHANVCEPPTLPTGMRHGEVRAWFMRVEGRGNETIIDGAFFARTMHLAIV